MPSEPELLIVISTILIYILIISLPVIATIALNTKTSIGTKYSRKKYWIWSIILLIISIPLEIISNAPMGNIKDTSILTILPVLLIFIIPHLLWINALVNRIRDYGGNPWIAAFALLPLANIGLALYYGIFQYKNKPVENNTNANTSPSLSKAIYNHSKDLASDIKPTINEYKENHQTSKTDISNISSINEDEIYEKVMIEIEEDNKVKSTWAKSLAQSDGDKDKAEAIYIKLRVKKEQEKNNDHYNDIDCISGAINKENKSTNTTSNIEKNKCNPEIEILREKLSLNRLTSFEKARLEYLEDFEKKYNKHQK